jgi:type II secretory pathway pseudopilin PulG
MPMHARRGISLFEAVAAMAIVGVIAASALSATGAEMRAVERSRRALEGEALATQRLDYLDMLTDLQLQSLPDTVAKGKFDAPLDEYQWETTATPVAEQGGVYDVRIRIVWPGNSYAVRTYAYRRPAVASR